MRLYSTFPSGWWPVLGIVYIPFLIIFFLRKSYKKKNELKNQLAIGFLVLGISFLIEYVSVSLGLWNYSPGNWPIPLWFGYFGSGLFGFQLLKAVEEFKK